MRDGGAGRRKVSAGGVVVRDSDAHLELCLITPSENTRVWALPKGRLEAGETPEQAALREVREETGIETVIEGELGSIDYEFWSRYEHCQIHKTVHFYLMRATGGDTSQHDHEVIEAAWFDVDGALDRMRYPNEREMVRRAVELTRAPRGS